MALQKHRPPEVICTYSIHDVEPVIKKQVTGKRFWIIKLWVENINIDGEPNRIEDEIRNTDPCHLTDLLQFSIERVNELLDESKQEFGGYTDAGFTIIKSRRKRRG